MHTETRPVAVVTGGSRGVGAACARALADRRFDVCITYRNKAARADEVAADVQRRGVRALAMACDITVAEERELFFGAFSRWSAHLDLLVLNASGGLERDLLAADPEYPMHINRDAQMEFLDRLLPCMAEGSTVIFVTSHWAHRYGAVEQLPAYEPIAASKHAGEHALRARRAGLLERGIRLLVVTGDLIEGSITLKLLERAAPGMTSERKQTAGNLPTGVDLGEAIAVAAVDPALPSGHTVVVGGPLESLPPV